MATARLVVGVALPPHVLATLEMLKGRLEARAY